MEELANIVHILQANRRSKTIHEMPKAIKNVYAFYKRTEKELRYVFFRIKKLCSGKFERYVARVKNYSWKTAIFPVVRQCKAGEL